MAIRMEKSGELMMIYGKKDELDDQKDWNNRRSRLGVFVVAVAIVAVVGCLAPHMPGYAMVSNAVRTVVAAIW